MKKAKSAKPDDMRAEYTRSDFPGGLVRGKYATRIAKGSNIVVLNPEVSAAFPTTEAVNEALASLIRVAKSATRPTSPSSGRRVKRAGDSK